MNLSISMEYLLQALDPSDFERDPFGDFYIAEDSYCIDRMTGALLRESEEGVFEFRVTNPADSTPQDNEPAIELNGRANSETSTKESTESGFWIQLFGSGDVGHMHFLEESLNNPSRYIDLPTYEDIDYNLLANDFVASLASDAKTQKKLVKSIRKKGIDALCLRTEWAAYRRYYCENLARVWCAEHNIKLIL